MKKILSALCICVALTACGEKSSIEGSFESKNRSGEVVAAITFKSNNIASLTTLDGSGGEFKYKIDGNKIQITGLVPSEYYINEGGNLANSVNRDVYTKK